MSRIAIVTAMAEELRGLLEHLTDSTCCERAGRQFWTGNLAGKPAVVVMSRIGKVAAATTAAILLSEFKVDRIFFTGVAGGLGREVRVGDIVVASELLQHDMDASPLFPPYEVPLYGMSRFPADAALSSEVKEAAQAVLVSLHETGAAGPGGTLQREHLAALGLGQPRIHAGLIVSGDRFVSSAGQSAALLRTFPDAMAVEMEGAAVAQVCRDFGVPFAMLRTVSDRADDNAHVDFNRFIADVACRYTIAVVLTLCA